MIEAQEMSKEEETKILVSYKLSPSLFEPYGLKVMELIPEKGAYRLQTDQGFHCLKKIEPITEDMILIHETIENFLQEAFYHVLCLRKTLEGQLYVQSEGDLYVLLDLIDEDM